MYMYTSGFEDNAVEISIFTAISTTDSSKGFTGSMNVKPALIFRDYAELFNHPIFLLTYTLSFFPAHRPASLYPNPAERHGN